MGKQIKGKSIEFWFVAVYMVVQFIILWLPQNITEKAGKDTFIISSNFINIIPFVVLFYYLLRLLLDVSKTKHINVKNIRIADVLILLLIIFGGISMQMATDVTIATYGTKGRYEGFYALCCYYAIFFCASRISDEKEKKIALIIMTSIFSFSCLIGILSGYRILNFPTTWVGKAAYPWGNPNFFGTVSSTAAAVGIALFIYAPKKLRITGIAMFAIAMGAEFCCDSSSPFVGNIMAVLLLVFMEVFLSCKETNWNRLKKCIISVTVLIVVALGVMKLVDSTRGGSVKKEVIKNVQSLDQGITADKVFTKRMKVWKVTLREYPKYWAFGIGIDNFYSFAEENGLNTGKKYYDKAHNEYLQILITEGIFSCVTYLVFLFVLFIGGLKRWNEYFNKKKWLYLVAFLVFFSYIAQAFFNIRMIYIAPFFWIVCGILYNNSPKKEMDKTTAELKEIEDSDK